MPEMQLLLTEHCSLCEQAFDVLLSTPAVAMLTLVTVDITDNDRLIDLYGEQIPVLLLNEQALMWPFSPAQVTAFVERARNESVDHGVPKK